MARLPARVLPVCLLFALLAACSRDPRLAARRSVATGNGYFAKGKLKEASILYRRALQQDPQSADAWYQLGLVNLRLSYLTDAQKDFAEAAEMDSAHMDALVRLGKVDLLFYAANPQINSRFLVELEDVSRRLTERNPKSFDGLRFSGELALIRGQLRIAIDDFERARQVAAWQSALVLELVQSLFLTGQRERAELLANGLIAREPTFGPIYDALYLDYMRTNRPALAEELLKVKAARNPEQGGYWMELAFHYHSTGQLKEMEQVINRLTADRQRFPDARLQVGDLFVRIGDFNRALAEFEAGKRENEAIGRACRKKIIEVLATQGRYAEAADLTASLVKENPGDAEVLALDATLELQHSGPGQAKAVIGLLQPLASKIPGNTLLHFNLGRAYRMLGDPSSLAQARIHFEQALRLDGSYVPALLGAAEVAFDGGDSAAALHYSEAVLRSDPRNLPARVYRARSLFSTSRFREARSEVELVLKLYPTSVDARYELARLDAHEERYDAAETSLGMLASGGDPRAPGALAELSLRMGRFRRAAVQYRALIARDSKNAALLVRLGECEAQLDHAEPAASAFLKAQAIAPADPRPRVDLAILYDRLGRNDDARRAYQAVLQVQPDNPVALNNLAALDAETGVNLDQALSNAHRAQDQRPKDPDIQDTVGLIYIQKNLKNEGLEILRRLVDQNPANATYRRHLALALYLKGDRPGARQNLESALRSKPGDREQGKIKALLAKVG